MQFDLGAASETKRPTSVVFVPHQKGWEFEEKLNGLITKVKKINPYF